VANRLLIEPIVKAVVAVFAAHGIKITVTSGLRSKERQAELYGTNNPYPVAEPGTSQHEYGLAVDMVANPRSNQALLGQIWKALGLYWSEADEVHFATFDRATWSYVLSKIKSPKVEEEPVYRTKGDSFLGDNKVIVYDRVYPLPPKISQPPAPEPDPPQPVSRESLYLGSQRSDQIRQAGYTVFGKRTPDT
jgi:hypothetical protein